MAGLAQAESAVEMRGEPVNVICSINYQCCETKQLPLTLIWYCILLIEYYTKLQ